MPLTLARVYPSFIGITAVNEHNEPVFNAVLASAVIVPSG
ncbi:MAG: hypothetical protein OFPII_31860 [Osedax symbiont Rs1]|nr:MAG: hypothetical protein OFPII_31860 [Osedax symbiont Rs1]